MLRYQSRTDAGETPPPPEGMYAPVWRLLQMRGVKTYEEAQAFLSPQACHLHDPFLLHDMEKAVARIRQGISQGQRMVVFGDYDVDGMTAASIVLSTLRSLGGDAQVYIPSRHQEGYGLREDALLKLAGTVDLLITVDCGITSCQEVEFAKRQGISVVVTDHHEPGETLPDCPVVNPLLGKYPFARLCGAGVAFKLSEALLGREAALELVDLAALGTVADLVPLLGENRVIVSLGLEQINKSPRPGVAALISAAGYGGKPLTTGQIAFALAPRLNAAGRISDAKQGVQLLLGEDTLETHQIAAQLSSENEYRQRIEKEMIAQAEGMMADFDFAENRAIVLCGEDWNAGVIGLAASRLTEKYGLPSVLLAREGEVYTGSCRSIEGVNIHAALSACQDLFVRFGGHKMAAGLTIHRDNVPAFKARLNQILHGQLPAEAFIPTQLYDLEMPIEEVDEELISALEHMQPVGFGNPAAVLRAQANVVSAKQVGSDKSHLKLTVEDGRARMGGIAFRMGDRAQRILGTRQDILFSPSINEWNNQRTVQLEVRALRDADVLAQDHDGQNLRAFLTMVLYNQTASLSGNIYRMDFQDMWESIDKAVAGGISGSLIVVASEKARDRIVSELSKAGLSGLVDVGMTWPKQARAFNALCYRPWGPQSVAYKNVFVADAMPESWVAAMGFLPRPGQSIHLPLTDEGFLRETLGAHVPTVDELRALYLAIVKNKVRLAAQGSHGGFAEALGQLCGVSAEKAILGMAVLCELELICFERFPFSLNVPAVRKRDPHQSALYRYLQK